MLDTLMIHHAENEVLKIKKKLSFFKKLTEPLKWSFKRSMLKKNLYLNLKINPLFKILTHGNENKCNQVS